MRIEEEFTPDVIGRPHAQWRRIPCSGHLAHKPDFDSLVYRYAMPGIIRLNQMCPPDSTVYRLEIPPKQDGLMAFIDDTHADGLPVRVVCAYDPGSGLPESPKGYVVLVDALWIPSLAVEPERPKLTLVKGNPHNRQNPEPLAHEERKHVSAEETANKQRLSAVAR